jgi:hypothetical protein
MLIEIIQSIEMKTFITVIILVIALFTMLMSMWGVGKADTDKDEAGKTTAGVFFGIGFVAFLVGLLFAIKMPEIENYCAIKK